LTRNIAVIPIKGLLDSKTRLSHSYSPQDRKKIIIALAKDVLTAVEESGLFNRVIVVSPDRNVEKEVDLPASSFLHQEGQGLNAGIRQSTLLAMREKASSVAVLLADIPLIEPHDLKELYSVGSVTQRVVLSPSLKGGTNVMIRAPPDLIAPAYGRWSFSNHLREAQKIGVPVYSVSNQRLSFDVDTPEDLISLAKRDPHLRTHSANSLQELAAPRVLARPSK
jgi:2-phospho-L-lactate/phosphoenolpyruvate guanylyltransferase